MRYAGRGPMPVTADNAQVRTRFEYPTAIPPVITGGRVAGDAGCGRAGGAGMRHNVCRPTTSP